MRPMSALSFRPESELRVSLPNQSSEVQSVRAERSAGERAWQLGSHPPHLGSHLARGIPLATFRIPPHPNGIASTTPTHPGLDTRVLCSPPFSPPHGSARRIGSHSAPSHLTTRCIPPSHLTIPCIPPSPHPTCRYGCCYRPRARLVHKQCERTPQA